MENNVKLHPSWLAILKNEFSQPYFQNLKQFLIQEKYKGYQIYPPGTSIFAALNHTPFDEVKVIILGQDPYHGIGQANGLSFSVNKGIKVPPSLKNIYKELETDIGSVTLTHGDLTSWAHQGVLLLNTFLTVRANEPASHQMAGWEIFTDSIIKNLNAYKNNLVFLLWGKFAQSKKILINSQKHLILEAAHPSPFSAHHGFLGCKHFSKTNKYLKESGIGEIDWNLK